MVLSELLPVPLLFALYMLSLTFCQEGRSALSLAADESRVDVMKVLIQRGADLNTQDRVNTCTLYMYILVNQGTQEIRTCTHPIVL